MPAVRSYAAGSILLLLAVITSVSYAREISPRSRYNVGYRVLDLKYQKDGEEQVLTVAVWYPTAAEPKPYIYGGPARGKVAVNAEPLAQDGPYPFLVFSHGYGGGGTGSVFFTEALAARGWIVACPDHHDSHSAVRIRTGQEKHIDRRGFLKDANAISASGPGDRGKYLYRLDEMRSALEGLLASAVFGSLIDSERIAVGGHSFGGFTALGLCGTIKERQDRRVKAVLLFSTGAGGYLFREGELAGVRVPSMLFMGEREEDQLRGSKKMEELSSKIFRSVSAPKYFLEIKGGSHFSFNNRFKFTLGARLLSGQEEHFEVIRRYSIAFLEKYVAGREDAARVLEKGDPLLVRYLAEPGDGSSIRH